MAQPVDGDSRGIEPNWIPILGLALTEARKTKPETLLEVFRVLTT
jgi:hypothetical protein